MLIFTAEDSKFKFPLTLSLMKKLQMIASMTPTTFLWTAISASHLRRRFLGSRMQLRLDVAHFATPWEQKEVNCTNAGWSYETPRQVFVRSMVSRSLQFAAAPQVQYANLRYINPR
jgi:hypothetical protein